FRGYLLDGFFNLAGALTGQSILLLGMMTEAVVTPWLSDRDLAVQNARDVINAAGNLGEDFPPAPGGVLARRAPGPSRAQGRSAARPASGARISSRHRTASSPGALGRCWPRRSTCW